MKRSLVYGALALLLGAFLGGELSLKWLLESPDGIRWLLGTVSRHTPVTLTVHTVSGGLGSALRLQGLSARWSGGELDVTDLRLSCQPLLMTVGSLAVQELSLSGVRLRDLSAPKSSGPEIVWPRISRGPAWFSAWIDHLEVRDLTYQNRDQPPVALPGFSAALAWRDSRLSATNLSLATAQGRLSGAISAGFDQPSLVSSLAFEPLKPAAGCSRFELRTRLQTWKSPELLAGEVTAAALEGKTARYTLEGRIGLTAKELRLQGVTLTGKGRAGSLRAEGSLPLSGEARLRLSAVGLDLAPELGEKIALSGTLDLSGDSSRYNGRFSLDTSGQGWRTGRFSGLLTGDPGGVDLSGVDAALLGGTVRGKLRAGWRDGLIIRAAVQGRRLDPQRLDPAWKGVLNFDLDSMAGWVGGRLNQGEAHGRLLESRLRGKALTGAAAMTLRKDDLRIDRLFLTGHGFDLHASGALSQRLEVTADISDISALVPRARGTLALSGWGRYAAGIASGEVSGRGRELAAEGIRIASASLNARLAAGAERSVRATAELDGLSYQGMRAKHASLQADGSLGSHRLELALRSDAAGMSGTVSGGYADGTWQGQLTGLAGNDLVGPWRLAAPASLTVSPRAVTVTPLVVTGLPAERAELTARLQLQPLQGTALAAWSGLDLSRANQWLGDTRIAGRSTGSLRLGLPGNDRLTLAGKASASGTVTTAQRTVTIQKALLDLDAGEWGTTATLEFRTAEGISVSGRFAAPVPATCSVPSKGELHASWQGLDPALAQTWLPRGVDLQGRLSGELAGRLLPEQRFDLNGTVTLADGKAGWRSEGRELTAAIQDAGLTWNWRGDSLSGALSMSLADSGEVRGNFRLPLPARTGAVPDRAGPVRGTFSGRFNEKGVLTSLFPGLLQETKGQLEADLRAGGTWQTPTLTGTAALTQAGAYLPAAGIRLADVRLNASLEGTQMKIESFRVKSGAGSLEGSADLSFAGNKLARYRGSLRGDGFQAVHLPELQLLVSPDLTFEGTPDSLTARGLIRVPEMLVNSPGSSAVVKPSRDTVVKGRTATASRDSGTALDLQFRLLLGEKVFVKSGGLDARLDGEVNLRMSGLSKATGSGEIKVARGNYTIYGVKLDIKRGRAIFSGGPVQRPALDILALREVDDVKAGVTVTGNPEAPVIKLYSEPTLPDTDILSYVVLGRKAREGGQQTALLMQAASLLASPGQTTSIQDKLKQLVRLDTLDYAPDKDRSPGYKPIETDLRANPQSKKDTTSVSQSVLLLGKFLTPELYVSYGRSLFTESQQFRARYSITKKWEVESKVSSDATGGDLYYRIEFD